jgi:hypothetical protein
MTLAGGKELEKIDGRSRDMPSYLIVECWAESILEEGKIRPKYGCCCGCCLKVRDGCRVGIGGLKGGIGKREDEW